MATLRYDNRGLLDSTIGEPFGISDEERRDLAEPLEQARRALREAHEQDELRFLDLPDRKADGIVEWAERKRHGRWTDAVVIGIGGSSLGTRALLDSARPENLDGLRLHVSENIDPESFGDLLDEVPLDTTLFVVVTKSGTTVETMGKFAIVYDRLENELGQGRASSQVVAITSPDSGELRALARRDGLESFSVPTNVGGRFSVLSPVGLVPLALAGYPIRELLKGARDARDRFLDREFPDNAVLQATADLHLLYERDISEIVMMAYSDRLGTLVDWFRQLWAESLGKAENRAGEQVQTGMTPIKAIGSIDQHSQVQLYVEGPPSRVVVFLETEQFASDLDIPDTDGLPEPLAHLAGHSLGDILNAELEGTQRALQKIDRPTARWTFEEVAARPVGGYLVAWETMTALMGELWNIDAFNQPGVELGKRIAHGLLGDEEASEGLDLEEGSESDSLVVAD
jgi:glucose-6-phosphate isomerase